MRPINIRTPKPYSSQSAMSPPRSSLPSHSAQPSTLSPISAELPVPFSLLFVSPLATLIVLYLLDQVSGFRDDSGRACTSGSGDRTIPSPSTSQITSMSSIDICSVALISGYHKNHRRDYYHVESTCVARWRLWID